MLLLVSVRQFVSIVAIVTTNLFASVIAQPISHLDGDDYYELGLSRYAQNDWEGAIAAFTQAININPNDRDSYYRRGFAYCKIRDSISANSDFNHSSPLHLPAYCLNGVLSTDSSGLMFQLDPQYLEKKGDELYKRQYHNRAIHTYQQASLIYRAQGKILSYRKLKKKLIDLMRPSNNKLAL